MPILSFYLLIYYFSLAPREQEILSILSPTDSQYLELSLALAGTHSTFVK